MHIVLQTEELRAMIFDELKTPDLGALATTCKELLEPVLRVLWAECSDFTYVVRLLPESAWSYRWNLGNRKEIYISRHLEERDIARIRYYASFIRRFDLIPHPGLRPYTPSSLADILDALRGEVLFPNLRDLGFYSPSTYLPSLLRLVSSSVIKLSICLLPEAGNTGTADDMPSTQPLLPSLETILSAIKERHSHHITTLHIWSAAADVWIADVLSGWDTLQDVQIRYHCNADMLLAVLALPRLRSLVIDGCSSSPMVVTLNQEFDTPLLRSMDLRCLSHITSATNVIASLRNAELVKIHAQANADRESLQNFFHALPNCCSPRSLRSLLVTSPYDGTTQVPLSLALMRPLLAFVELTNLVLAMPSEYVSNDDIRQLACALPRLEKLSLVAQMFTQSATPKITLSGLVWLARYCHRLQTLNLSIDATNTLLPEGMPADCTQNSLINLGVSNSPISSHIAVASFLSRFFPFLHDVFPRDKLGDRTSEWWRVGHAIPLFVEARDSGFQGQFHGVRPPPSLSMYDFFA
ncbi:hypothetical protein BD626DRAFT_625777 [Schizophyllum amplum]|uniref:F-box domain-containing protein n=1 Tax=Schizophyllum amplum TaxID=97359 RepID=A0A550D0S3_9AGAR|nr:hypothetical protein BD626DRAFT_625777 [Auriculariopsis ampla]